MQREDAETHLEEEEEDRSCSQNSIKIQLDENSHSFETTGMRKVSVLDV